MENFLILLILLNSLQLSFSYLPDWNLTSSGIYLFSSEPYEYEVCEREMYGLYAQLKKSISLANNSLSIKHNLIAKYNGEDKNIEVDFDNIESCYYSNISKPIICPKGKYHIYDVSEGKYIIPNNFTEFNDWELKCYFHNLGYFLVFYFMNGKCNFYITKYNIDKLEQVDNFFGDELYTFNLNNHNFPSQMASIIKSNNTIILQGSMVSYPDNKIKNDVNGTKIISEAKNYTQVVFQNYSDNFYFFTYNNISDFTCGYSIQYANESNYDNVSKYEIIVHNNSPLEFIGDVEILEMNFSSYNKYAFYKIYEKESNKIFNGFIDVTLNKVVFNTYEAILSFSAYNNNSMLAITSSGIYQICGIKNGDNCIDSCEESENNHIVFDADNGNICSNGCENQKFLLMPSEVCISNCNENLYINNGSHCGLCEYFYPGENGKKYKFYNGTECISDIPEGGEIFNLKLNLLSCGKGYIFNGTTCIPHCYETCFKCSEYSTNSNQQKCLSCNNSYNLEKGNCIPIVSCLDNTKEKCALCSEESNKYELCIICNRFYKKINYTDRSIDYLDCFKPDDDLLNFFYYDNTSDVYRPCYKTCKKCLIGGDAKTHNCLECKNGLIFRPWDNPYNNCVVNTTYYYRNSYEQYKALKVFQCPEEAKFTIKEKNSCINDCKKDNEYKYLFNGNCIKNCSIDNTIEKEENFICKVYTNKCVLGKNNIYLENDDLNIIETLVKSYVSEFNYTQNFLSLFENINYTIIIYKNSSCVKELSLKIPFIDFVKCYKNVQDEYNIKENLIISIAEKKEQNNPETLYSFFHPKSGIKLDAKTICKDDNIKIHENMLEFLDENNKYYEGQIHLLNQGINIFDINDPFYNDICFDFDNPLKKDIPLKFRIKYFFPNATLCDNGCYQKEISKENHSVECECKFNDLDNSKLINEIAIIEDLMGDVLDMINSSNILVFKCIKYIFKYFKRSIGGMISVFLILSHIVMVVLYFIVGFAKIKVYILSLTKGYISYIKKKDNTKINVPPKNRAKSRQLNNAISFKKESIDLKNDKSKHSSISNTKFNLRKQSYNTNLTVFNTNKDGKISNKSVTKFSKKKKKSNVGKDLSTNITKKDIKFFKEYLSTSPDDMSYDDAIVKDKRNFWEGVLENIQEKQNIVYTFITEDPIKPRIIKIIVFILNVMLYFVVDGLFFNEEVVSEIYIADENKENFFSYLERSIDEIFYSTLVSLVIDIITDFFFVEENKIKGIFKREKDNHNALHQKITEFLKDIKKRYIAFIIFSSVILILSFFYLLCFNYVYPYSQIEWIKSSITIAIVIELFFLLECILESVLRFLSFKLKNERIYKLSQIFD